MKCILSSICSLACRFGLAIALSFCGVGCATSLSKSRVEPPLIIAQANFNHGNAEYLYLVWIEGKVWLDSEPPSYRMGEKYSGKFAFRVQFDDGKTVDTPFESLGSYMPDLFFVPTETQTAIRPIFVDDYNNDGQPDFNIVSRIGMYMDACYLFTILPSGKIDHLKINYPGSETASELAVNDTDSDRISTDEFTLTPHGFYYINHLMVPREDELVSLDWQEREQAFYYRDQTIKTR